MSQELVPTFKRSLAPEIEQHMLAFAFVYVVEARRQIVLAARLYGITPLHARRIVETQPEWGDALQEVMFGRVRELVGNPGVGTSMAAAHNVVEALVSHPQADLLALPQPWTRQALDEGLMQSTKDCIKSLRWRTQTVVDDEWQEVDVEVLDSVQWHDHRWEATLRVLENEGVKKVKIVPIGADDEPVSGFGGMIVNFVNEPVE